MRQYRQSYSRIVLTMLLGLATVLHLVIAHGIDASVVLCFGEDGHIAFERAVPGVHQTLECHPNNPLGNRPALLDADASQSDCDCVDIVFSSHNMQLLAGADAGLTAGTQVALSTAGYESVRPATSSASEISCSSPCGISPPLLAIQSVHLLI